MQLLRKLAFPIALLYAAGVTFRNALFNNNILRGQHFSTPVVSVGNLSVGGTGKTPMIEWLVSHLGNKRKIAVVSRGYKRKSSGMQLADSQSTATSIGDEPLQLLRKFPDLTIIVDANRRRAITYLEKHYKPDLILLDDAHQHRKVNPKLALVLTQYNDLYVDDWWLPTGNLRDAVSAAKRANVIIVTKCPRDLSDGDKMKILSRLKVAEHQQVLFSTLHYGEVIIGEEKEIPLALLSEKSFTLVTGIARPEPLVKHLVKRGLTFEHMKFGDHHNFSIKELEEINAKGLILTTAKDYSRLMGKIGQLYYLEVSHDFLDGDGERLMEELLKL